MRIESEPLGCAAYVNGRNLGATPKELSRLSPGEYRIQAECEPGVMGRVHRVALSNNRVVMRVDTRYDRAIETLFDLSLNYASSSEEHRYLARDAVETARIVGASDVVVAYVEASGREAVVKVDRYRVADGVHLGFVRMPVDTRAGTVEGRVLALARAALEANAPADLTGPTPQPLAPPEPLLPASPPAPPPPVLAEPLAEESFAPAARSARARGRRRSWSQRSCRRFGLAGRARDRRGAQRRRSRDAGRRLGAICPTALGAGRLRLRAARERQPDDAHDRAS